MPSDWREGVTDCREWSLQILLFVSGDFNSANRAMQNVTREEAVETHRM